MNAVCVFCLRRPHDNVQCVLVAENDSRNEAEQQQDAVGHGRRVVVLGGRRTDAPAIYRRRAQRHLPDQLLRDLRFCGRHGGVGAEPGQRVQGHTVAESKKHTQKQRLGVSACLFRVLVLKNPACNVLLTRCLTYHTKRFFLSVQQAE
jgi:hypothetical protein